MSLSVWSKRSSDWLALIIGSLLIFGVTYFALTETKNGDFTHSLLVSQALIEHQTVQLDVYKDKLDRNRDFDHDYRIEQINGHYYYLFPLVPSVFSVPVVWVANLLGQEMFIHEQEYMLLKLLAAISCGLIFIVIYALSRCYLSVWPGFIIAFVSMLGTNLVSSLGAALSSMNFAVFFVLLALLLIVLYDTGRLKVINPYLLGALLFFAFWSRPTVAPFILVVFVYLFLKDRANFLKLAITAFVPLLLFVGWSWLAQGRWLPYFYSPGRLIATPTFWTAFYGNAFSPARGLFVFSPFFLLTLAGALLFFRDLRKDYIFWLCLLWFAIYYIAIARKNEDWWGGHNYGPRILTDGMPALILLTILIWRTLSRQASQTTKTLALSSYAILGIGAILIHSYQGLYNPSTYQWNKNPNIDRYPEYLFNWKYPQFLATEAALKQRSLEHQQSRLTPYAVGNVLTYNTRDAVFWNWSEPEISWRWSEGESPRIVFRLGSNVIDPNQVYTLEILTASLQNREVPVMLNGVDVGHLSLEAFSGNVPETQRLIFTADTLRENGLNVVEFLLPEVSPPTSTTDDETQPEGIAFVSMELRPTAANSEGVNYFDSEFFQTGFSNVEKGWRWTDGTAALLTYPLGEVNPGQLYEFELTAGALTRQTVGILVNGRNIGTLTFAGFEPVSHKLTLTGDLLEANSDNRVHLLIPGASVPPGDSRRLGLSFVSLKIYPASQG